MFSLRFPVDEFSYWADRYEYSLESEIVDEVAPRARSLGYFTRPDFLAICRWKSPRTKPHVEANPEAYIQEVTRVAFSTPSEQLRIEVLTLLKGVSWPTASVMLHLVHEDPYPLLDYRALWSLGIDTPPAQYDFGFWWDYTQYCRELANATGLSMRELDRALWQYSKENQPPDSSE